MKVLTISGLSDRKRAGIFEHVFSNKDREVAGVLVGEHFDNGSIWIADYIPAEEADEKAAAVTFTHESWDRILKVKDTDFADLEIVGWYHSHPGYGLFLSNDDMFMHRNFFPAWWQIAYVVDPINEEGGIFTWRDSETDTEMDTEMEMFERHEAHFEGTGPVLPSASQGDIRPDPPASMRWIRNPLPGGMLGIALAAAGIVVLLALLVFVLLGSSGSGDGTPTVLPTEQRTSSGNSEQPGPETRPAQIREDQVKPEGAITPDIREPQSSTENPIKKKPGAPIDLPPSKRGSGSPATSDGLERGGS